jgi:hypothetical protein
MRRNEVEGLAVPAVDIPKFSVADADRILQHGCKHRLPGELLMTLSTSDVAVCCSSASVRSAVRSVRSVVRSRSSLNNRTFSIAITA